MACIKVREAKFGNGRHHERRSWCRQGRFCPSGCPARGWTSYIFRLFRHFGRALLHERPLCCLSTITYARKRWIYSSLVSSSSLRSGCDLWRRRPAGLLCAVREKGARSPWILRVRCRPCAIILANALTERVWSAAPGLREKRSWAASLFTLARARRSLPSSDLNGHCLSRGAVSLATRGQKRACRARHPAAKQGGTAEFSRPWVSEKRPRTVFYCRVRAGRGMGPVQTGKEDR